MKNKISKFGILFTILCNGTIVSCLIIGLIMIFQLKQPDKLDPNTFIHYIEEKGCSIIDIQEKEKYSGVETYLVTDQASCPYLISYTIFNDKDRLDTFFMSGRHDVLYENNHIKRKNSIEINLFFEYYEYSTSGDYYKTIVYNDNTILYASANQEYEAEIMHIFQDFNYNYEVNFDLLLRICYPLCIIYLMNQVVSMWKIEKKIRKKGWIVLIPFYNISCLSKDILGSAWYSLLLLFPVFDTIFLFLLYYYMGKVFNKKKSYCIFMMFFPSILCPLLAFDNSTYDSSKVMHK